MREEFKNSFIKSHSENRRNYAIEDSFCFIAIS